jgi:hypothetical protein
LKDGLHKKLLHREMTRGEFLQFVGGSVVVLFGFGNLISLITHFTKTVEPPKIAQAKDDTRHGFGSRKFGA